MGLSEALLLEPVKVNVWFAVRTDSVCGSGTAQDPFNGAPRRGAILPVTLTRGTPPAAATREAIVTTGPVAHGFQEGDVVEISGVTGVDPDLWNGTFGIYGVTEFSFKYLMKKEPDPSVVGSPACVRLTFPFDEIMRTIPPYTRIQLGAGVFQTRGFAPNDSRGWQPKTGQKIVGAGMDITTLQLVGAENADQHYHVIGMPIEPAQGSATPIAALATWEAYPIHTSLQRGARGGQIRPNRFNGFLRPAAKTVKTVPRPRRRPITTSLKRGVNGNRNPGQTGNRRQRRQPRGPEGSASFFVSVAFCGNEDFVGHGGIEAGGTDQPYPAQLRLGTPRQERKCV